MRYEIDLSGVLVPSLLVWLLAAYALCAILRSGFPTNWPLPALYGTAHCSTSLCSSACWGGIVYLSSEFSAVKITFAFLRRVAVTTVAVLAAFLVGGYLWIYYMMNRGNARWPRPRRYR